jgi:hypothetical protein
MKKLHLALTGLACLLFSHCSNDNTTKVAKQLEVKQTQVDEIKLDVKIKRLDQDLLENPKDELSNKINTLKKEYGTFFNLYTKNVLNIGLPNMPGFNNYLKGFVNDVTVQEVYAECKRQYSDLSFLHDELGETFKRYKYYYPKKVIPSIVTMFTGFNYSVITTDSVIGVGLEMYLGKNCKFYPMLSMPAYKSANMNKNRMVVDIMKAWIDTEFEYKETKNDNLLNEIIKQGKYMVFLDAVIPDVEDSLKIGYSTKQMKWIEKFEKNVWQYMIEKKHLYTHDYKTIKKYTSEGPFTSLFTKESPPQLGYYIGWQIVRAYMQNNPNITLQQLMKETNSQKILSQSKYKPKAI